MNQLHSVAILSLCFLTSAQSQDVFTDRTLDSVAREFVFQLRDQHAEAEAAAARRRDAQYRERQFVDKVNRFVEVWSAFAMEYNQKRAFNVKVAKEISKAFHDLEISEGWPRFTRK